MQEYPEMHDSIVAPIIRCVKVAFLLKDGPDSEVFDNHYYYLYQHPAVLEDVIWWLHYKIESIRLTAAAGLTLGEKGQEVNHYYKRRAVRWEHGTKLIM